MLWIRYLFYIAGICILALVLSPLITLLYELSLNPQLIKLSIRYERHGLSVYIHFIINYTGSVELRDVGIEAEVLARGNVIARATNSTSALHKNSAIVTTLEIPLHKIMYLEPSEIRSRVVLSFKIAGIYPMRVAVGVGH